MSKDNNNLVQEWLDLADNDLGFAKAAFNDFDDFYSQMCIQAHQAVEKYLKGFLVANEKKFPKIHDLAYLITKCIEIDRCFEEYLDACNKITDYYIHLRYPVALPPRTKEEVKKAIEVAEDIGKLVKAKVNL